MNNAFSQPSLKEEITFPDTAMERSHGNEKLRGLYLPDFLGGSRVMWLKDTASSSSVLSFKVYDILPDGVSKFNLSSLNSAIALADG